MDSLELGASDLPVLEVAFARVFSHNSRRGDQDSYALTVVCDTVSTVFPDITWVTLEVSLFALGFYIGLMFFLFFVFFLS